MPPKIDITGKTYGKLRVLCESKEKKHNRVAWVCICDCKRKIIATSNDLRTGKVKSCTIYPCRKYDTKEAILANTKHGGSHSRLYNIWVGLRRRCKIHESYSKITFCDEWKEFKAFEIWAKSSGYSDDLTIDRIDNLGNYSPENCRWANMEVQGNNRRTNRYVEYKGKTYTVSRFCKKYNINKNSFTYRLNKGHSPEKILKDGGLSEFKK